MKHLLTLTALLVSSLAMAQMPYNPDSNGDDLIGSEDLLTFLGVYNTLLIDSSLTCDYEGTELEDLCIGLVDATLQLDSVYVEYLLHDTISYYQPGCPDLVFEPVVLERAYMFPSASYSVNSDGDISVYTNSMHLNYSRAFRIEYYADSNTWRLLLYDYEIDTTTSYSFVARWFDAVNGNETVALPFPENWTLDENGIQVGFRPNNWVSNCEHFRLIPYWHEAE